MIGYIPIIIIDGNADPAGMAIGTAIFAVMVAVAIWWMRTHP